MRSLVLLALLLGAPLSTADVRTWSSGPECHSDGSGWSCASATERRTGVWTANGDGVWLTEESRWSHGNHTGHSGNAWNSSRQAYGVGARHNGTEHEVILGLREYRASQEADGKTRRTTDNTVELERREDDGISIYRASVTERRVEGAYTHCVVTLLNSVAVDVACGESVTDEAPLP